MGIKVVYHSLPKYTNNNQINQNQNFSYFVNVQSITTLTLKISLISISSDQVKFIEPRCEEISNFS